MRILTICSELAPIAKTGGLADAVAGLSAALAHRGHDVRVLLPRYPHLRYMCEFGEAIRDRSKRFRYVPILGLPRNLSVYLLELDSPSEASIYSGDERDAARFLQLSVAALHLSDALAWRPEVFHCHDWHAALVPALPGSRDLAPSMLTIHNMNYQGAYDAHPLIGNCYADVTPYIDPAVPRKRAVNYLRAGIVSATAITTVSPTYAREICTPKCGMGLHRFLAARKADLTGIVNGVDYAIWSPEHDPLLDEHYDVFDRSGKQRLKARLCRELHIHSSKDVPVIAVLSRLDSQKGTDLLIRALPRLLRKTRAVFVVHGNGKPAFANKLTAIAEEHTGKVAFVNGYDESLAHLILAGSDLLLMPSRFEPCGLTQLYALRYGTIPIVRNTGGLADTIKHFNPLFGTGTGVVFKGSHAGNIVSAARTALTWFENELLWQSLMTNAMRADFSWRKPVEAYEAVYRRIA